VFDRFDLEVATTASGDARDAFLQVWFRTRTASAGRRKFATPRSFWRAAGTPFVTATLVRNAARRSSPLDADATEQVLAAPVGDRSPVTDPLRTPVDRAGPDSPICPTARQTVSRARPSTEFRRA